MRWILESNKIFCEGENWFQFGFVSITFARARIICNCTVMPSAINCDKTSVNFLATVNMILLRCPSSTSMRTAHMRIDNIFRLPLATYCVYKIKLIHTIQRSMWNYLCETFIYEISAFRPEITFYVFEDCLILLDIHLNIANTIKYVVKSYF